jgi:hypothetical protein
MYLVPREDVTMYSHLDFRCTYVCIKNIRTRSVFGPPFLFKQVIQTVNCWKRHELCRSFSCLLLFRLLGAALSCRVISWLLYTVFSHFFFKFTSLRISEKTFYFALVKCVFQKQCCFVLIYRSFNIKVSYSPM